MITPDWQPIISEIITVPGIAMVVGAVDAGKTRFCHELSMAAFEAGVPTAVVDADIGQSEIGAPGTVGMAIVDRCVESLSELKAKRLHFVGATNPAEHMLECVVGTKRMTDAALALGAKMVVLDTTGLVGGQIGRRLKTSKVDLVRPNYLIGIEKKNEIDHLLLPFAHVSSMKVKRVISSEEAKRKLVEFRTARRRSNYYRHFVDAQSYLIRLDDVSLWNTWLGAGRLMKWQYIKTIEDTIKCPVMHVEVTGRGIYIVSERHCSMSNRSDLEEQFKTAHIITTTAAAFENVLVGFADENANTINVGLIQAIDFKRRFMSIISPIKTVSPVKIIQFGSIRVNREGEELGSIKPGEI